MLQAHSLLWHYLWVAPNLLLFALAVILWRRRVQSTPMFVLFAVVTAIAQLVVYIADVLPFVSPVAWWQIFWGSLLVDTLVKFCLIGHIFGRVFGPYPSLAKLSKSLISAVGVILVLLAAVTAAYTPKNNIYWIVSGAHVLEQAIYMIECGLVLFLFALAAHFKLQWSRPVFGITLGLGISACVHLATWALMANPDFSAPYHVSLVFLNMATYHACVLIWFYYLLVPEKKVPNIKLPRPEDSPPAEHDLEVWNQELERLLHQ
jgi:hypothetical protein